MKKIKDLDEFESDNLKNEIQESLQTRIQTISDAMSNSEEEPLDEMQIKKLPEKSQFRFSLSDSMKKVAKIQKTMIDLAQLLTEMSDQFVALKLNFPNMDAGDLVIVNNMKYNCDNMLANLKREKKSGKLTGTIDNAARMLRNLEKLKKDFLKAKDIHH